MCASLFSLLDHPWPINGSLRTFSGLCGGMTLGVRLLAGSRRSALTNKHSLFTCRKQHGSLGTCHLLGRQHRPCLSALLHSCGTHTTEHDPHTHILSLDANTQSVQPSLTLHLDASTQAVPPLPLSILLPCSRVAAAAPRNLSRAAASCSTADGPTSPLQVQREALPLMCSCRFVCLSAHPPLPGLEVLCHRIPSHLIPSKAMPTRPTPTHNVSTALAGTQNASPLPSSQLPDACTALVGQHLPSSSVVQAREASTALAGTQHRSRTLSETCASRSANGAFCAAHTQRALLNADSDLMHHQHRLSVLQRDPGPARKNPTQILAGACGYPPRSPVIMLRESRTSSSRTRVTPISLSCSTRTRSSPTPLSSLSPRRHLEDGGTWSFVDCCVARLSPVLLRSRSAQSMSTMLWPSPRPYGAAQRRLHRR